MLQPLWKSSAILLKKLNIQLYTSLILLNRYLLGRLEKTTHMKTHNWVFLSVSDRASLVLKLGR